MIDAAHQASFEALASFVSVMADGVEESTVLDELASRLTTSLDASGACIALEDHSQLRLASVYPAELRSIAEAQLDPAGSPSVEAFATGSSVAVRDVRASQARWVRYADSAAALGFQAALGLPLVIGSHPAGAVTVVSAAPREWSAVDVALARAMTDLVAGSLRSLETVRRERELADQLQHALNGRVRIEQAKGMLAESAGISISEAFERIRRHARSHNVKVEQVAEAVVSLGLRPNA